MFKVLGQSELVLHVNGEERRAIARPVDTLLFVLREKLGLTGAKPACENGDCGTCTVLVDGEPIKACLMLAVEAVGHEVTTVEGLRSAAPIQAAFVEHFAFQCGYCTPGFIVLGHALATLHPGAGDDLVAEWLEANLCRCTGYEEIKAAVKAAQR